MSSIGDIKAWYSNMQQWIHFESLSALSNSIATRLIIYRCDAEFIMHVQNDIPWLLEELETAEARAENAEDGERALKEAYRSMLCDRDRWKARTEMLMDHLIREYVEESISGEDFYEYRTTP